MRYLSVCSGIEAATVAWQSLGWIAHGFSEIEKFPNAVLQHHYPNVQNFGDMTDHEGWPDSSIDVLVGGTPCQSFSVAGLRQGMADPRGNLALVYLAITEQYRPRWLVWENVAGVLSSNGGRDFGSIIGGMVELGYGIAYRVLDAQYFGVPQRRRRVFVVGYIGDWRRAVQVLFEPASLRRHPPPGRKTRERIADSSISRALTSSPTGTGRLDPNEATYVVGAQCADAHPGAYSGQDAYSGRIIADPIIANEDLVAFAQNQRDEVRVMDKAGALAAEPGAKQQTYVFEPRFARNDRGAPDTVCPPLKAQSGKTGKGDAAPVVLQSRPSAQGCDSYNGVLTGDTAATLNRSTGESANHSGPQLLQDMAVRRLTPLECERLQGFPDGYTDIPGASDSARYKALGNSMAVPVMRWIGERITDQTGRSQRD